MSEAMILTNTVLKGILTDGLCYRGSLGSQAHLDDYVTTGFWIIERAQGLPSSIYQYGILEVLATGSRKLQKFYPDYGNRLAIWRMRVGAGWTSWRTFAGENL